MAIQHISGQDAKDKIGKGTQILSVGADWCGPCKMMAPQLKELSAKVEVFKVDADKNKEYAKEMGVTGLPTTFIYKDGKIADTFVGFVPKEEIEGKL